MPQFRLAVDDRHQLGVITVRTVGTADRYIEIIVLTKNGLAERGSHGSQLNRLGFMPTFTSCS